MKRTNADDVIIHALWPGPDTAGRALVPSVVFTDASRLATRSSTLGVAAGLAGVPAVAGVASGVGVWAGMDKGAKSMDAAKLAMASPGKCLRSFRIVSSGQV